MIRFQHIELLWLLWIIPLIIITYIFLNIWKKKKLREWGNPKLISRLTHTISKQKKHIKFILFTLGICFLILALCNLQMGSKTEKIKKQGIDIVVLLDISNSMNAEDVIPNRLASAKRNIYELIEQLKTDRIGIVVFAAQSFIQLPITTDYAAAKLFTKTISTQAIATQGTAIGDAISSAVKCFQPESKTQKAIILISDGENHEDNAIEAFEQLGEKGIRVYSIGIGTKNGAPIPIYKNLVQQGFLKDKNGTTVITKLNEQILAEIALKGNGIFVKSNHAKTNIKEIMNELDKLQKTEYASTIYTDYEDRFQIFLIIALLLFITDLLISERRNFRFSSIDLFGEKK